MLTDAFAGAAPSSWEEIWAEVQGQTDVVDEAEFRRRLAADPSAIAANRAMMEQFGEAPAQAPDAE